MQILYIILTLTIVLAILAIFKRLESLGGDESILPKLCGKKQPPPKPVPFRILVAIRRRDVGRARFMQIPAEGQKEVVENTRNAFADLHKEWSNHVKYMHGFDGSDVGLVSNTENEWLHFALYNAEGYEAYRECQRILDSEKYLTLKNEFDIRLLFGDQMKSPASRLHELF